MEAVGAASAIIAVLQITASVIHVSSEYIRAAKNAGKSAERLRKELKDFRGILEELEEHAEDERANGGLIAEMRFLKALEEPLGECKAMLLKMEEKIQIPTEIRKIKNALLWPFREKEVEKYILTIRNFKESFHLALSLDNTALVKEVWKDVQALNNTQIEISRSQVLKWLEVSDIQLNHNLARGMYHEKTGLWFLNSIDFGFWQDTPKSFLWLHGIPGCGKTILTSSIVEHIRNHKVTTGKDSTALAYFYFDYKQVKDQSVSNFLSSILAQLCRSLAVVPEPIQRIYTSYTYQDQCGRPNFSAFLEVLFEVSKLWHHVWLVVDALDECDLQIRGELLEVLERIASSNADIRILATSRPEPDITETLDAIVDRCIPIQTERVDVDISLYVRSVLRTDAKMKRWLLSDKQLVEETLIRKANGMFRWAFCQLDTLRRCINRASVRKTLDSLPKTLDQTYERIILSIQEEHRLQAIIALHWLSYTRRPLKLFELAEAVAVDTSDEDYYPFSPQGRLFRPDLILEICSSLVSASGTEHSADVRLAHFSVQEYLLSDRIRKSPAAAFGVDLAKGNAIMASFCVSYMLGLSYDRELEDDQPPLDEYSDEFEQRPSDYSTEALMQDGPLLRYVVEYWYQHANSLTQHRPELSTMILQLLSYNSQGFGMLDWWNFAARFHIGLWYELSDIQLLGGSIGVAAYLGLFPEVKLLLELDLGAESRAERMGTALQAAAYGGHLDIVEMVLSKGADPNSSGGIFGNSLQAAAHKGSKAITAILLNKGANLNASGGKHGSALEAAVSTGHREVAAFLLQSGADPNVGIGFGPYGCALQASAYRVDNQTTNLLLEKGADPNTSGGKYGTALQAAAYRSSKHIVQQLLEHGADPNIEGGEYGSALQAAKHWGNTEIIEVLLDYGADPNASSGIYAYGTALQAAANWGTKDIVKLLLERGADPNIEAGDYGSALDAAINRADGDICEMLIDKGAKIEVEDGDYKDLLNSATQRRSSKEVAEILITKNADQKVEMGCYGKAIQLAALKGYKEGVKLSNAPGGSALPESLSARHYATLKLAENLEHILSKPDDELTVNYSSPFSTLHWAAWNDHPEVVEFLSKTLTTNDDQSQVGPERPSLKGTFSNNSFSNPSAGLSKIEDPFDASTSVAVEDWSPLHIAIFRNHVNAIKALTDSKHPHDFGGDPELRVAAREVLENVFDRKTPDAIETLTDSLGWTIIHVAALLGKETLLQHLSVSVVEFDISMPDINGMTALHWAAAAGQQDVIRLLLSMNADPDAKDNWKRTAASLAAGESRLSILNMLTDGQPHLYSSKTILSNGINCACWRTCDSCDAIFRHDDLFLHCEACNDLDLCERCLLRERGCKSPTHSPELWVLYCRMVSPVKDFKSIEDVLISRAVPDRFSVVM